MASKSNTTAITKTLRDLPRHGLPILYYVPSQTKNSKTDIEGNPQPMEEVHETRTDETPEGIPTFESFGESTASNESSSVENFAVNLVSEGKLVLVLFNMNLLFNFGNT